MSWLKDKIKKFWKWIVGIFVITVVAGGIANFGGQSASITNEAAIVFGKIRLYEEKTMAERGRYIQFRQNETTYDGENSVLWNKSVKPTDVSEDWTTILDLPNKSLANYKVDVYEGKAGWGYIMAAFYKTSSGDYSYFEHVGPDTSKDAGEKMWTEKLFPTPDLNPSITATASYE